MTQNPPTPVAQWIASIYDERDAALARNRDLEEWMVSAQELIEELADYALATEKERDALKEEISGFPYAVNIQKEAVQELQSLARDYEAMLSRWDPITPDFKPEHEYDRQRLELRARYDEIVGDEK